MFEITVLQASGIRRSERLEQPSSGIRGERLGPQIGQARLDRVGYAMDGLAKQELHRFGQRRRERHRRLPANCGFGDNTADVFSRGFQLAP